MKKHLLLFSTILSITLITSCKDDGPDTPPLVGEWELKQMTMSNAPSTFSSYNGYEDDNIYGETEYTFTFNSDLTYSRLIKVDGRIYEDEGDWDLNGEDLSLDQEDSDLTGLVVDYTLEEDISAENLVMTAKYSFLVWPDIIVNDTQALDTIETQDEYTELANKYVEEVEFNVLLEFAKN